MRIDGISAEITVIRSGRRTLAAEIRPDGSVTVRAPYRLPEHEIRRFLCEKAAAIEKNVQKQRSRCAESETLPPLTAAELRGLAERAAAYIPPRAAYYAQKLGVRFGRITIRNQKTRWGSCTEAGNLNFNCLLMLMPPEVLDSVVVHELCHIRHHDHSKAFYAEVYSVFPDYDRCDRWLKENGPLLIRRMIAGRQT
ncbi:MAG: M48 family metallopeptidase [Oscillospiraceae bacterium]|nr:M48 family metallopeptidase [Oscillospiraceae bacterium]